MNYPSGPPAFWQSNARNAAVQRGAQLQTSLNADPNYVRQYLAMGQRPDLNAIEGLRGVMPQTTTLMHQQTNEQQRAADEQQRLAVILQGLRTL